MTGAAPSHGGVSPDGANVPLRPPAVLAKSAASLDVLTGGRVELGLGAGGVWEAIEAYGGPRRQPRAPPAPPARAVGGVPPGLGRTPHPPLRRPAHPPAPAP